MNCELCGSENLIYLGQLGFYWFRCQECGAECFSEVKPDFLPCSEDENEQAIKS
jgi:hypothetical protein